ncbi:SDR family oxidoreductase [Jiangella ureilytica]|uniref:SDR family oxidoreductase n=1 Tax=Jiangella ureilytica TaxID=2530374 RepID=A0A4V2XW51_9ACTN|nr:SDR family oxidoreductase [Jiangella ureilytica]TDC47925.1 SDR family oxidoreductase [Jiangella ureilytica]
MTQDSSRVALIVGGTTGIGLATAHALHQHGYAVVVTGRNPETLAAAQRQLPPDVTVLRADAASLTDADDVVTLVKERFETVDVVFLNAAVVHAIAFEDLDEATFDHAFGVNVKGQSFLLQKLLPLLTRGSSVIFTSSIGSEKALPSQSIYTATKGAQIGLMRALAAELAPRGIRVNAVSPGPIDTPAPGKLGLPEDVLGSMREAIASHVPLGRWGRAEEVAEAVAFLASPRSSYVTGANSMVGGGFGVAL